MHPFWQANKKSLLSRAYVNEKCVLALVVCSRAAVSSMISAQCGLTIFLSWPDSSCTMVMASRKVLLKRICPVWVPEGILAGFVWHHETAV
jgi:integral membrane sensor domain MASE1